MIAVSLQNSELTTGFTILINGLKLVAMLMAIYLILIKFQKNISIKFFIKILIFSVLGIYTDFQIKTFSFFSLFLLLASSGDITDGEFINLFFKGQIFNILFSLITWPIGILLGRDSLIYGSQSFQIAEGKISWGMIHPNIAATIFCWTFITYLVIQYKNKRLSFDKLVILLLFAVLIQITTKSDVVWFFYIFIIGILFIKNTLLNKLIIVIGKNIFWILGILLYFVILAYRGWGPTFLQKFSQVFNDLLSQRISMSSLALMSNGITFLGHLISQNNILYGWTAQYNYNRFTIDVFYTFLAVEAGLIYFILISIGLFKLCKMKGTLFSLCVIIFSLFGLADANLIFITTTFVMFYMREFILDKIKLSKLNDFWNN